MEMTVYNPQKGRLETIDAVITDKNTTWFDNCMVDEDIYMITDFGGGIIVRELGYGYPIWIYDVSRAEIAYDQIKAKQLKNLYA